MPNAQRSFQIFEAFISAIFHFQLLSSRKTVNQVTKGVIPLLCESSHGNKGCDLGCD